MSDDKHSEDLAAIGARALEYVKAEVAKLPASETNDADADISLALQSAIVDHIDISMTAAAHPTHRRSYVERVIADLLDQVGDNFITHAKTIRARAANAGRA